MPYASGQPIVLQTLDEKIAELQRQVRQITAELVLVGQRLTAIEESITQLSNTKVDRAGDTMTGNLNMTNVGVVLNDRSETYIQGANGNYAGIFAKKEYNANHWYPAITLETKGGGSWQIGNYNNENLEFVYANKANRDSETNTTTKLTLDSSNGAIIQANGSTDIKFSETGKGFYLKDSAGNNYPAAYDNGSNLWVGAEKSASTHHIGKTYISAGHTGSAGNTTIYVSVPNAANTGATNYEVYHKGYKPTASDVGLSAVTNDKQMPIAGGTFTGNAIAYTTNRSTNGGCLRNIEVRITSTTGTLQSTNKIIMVRK